MRKLQTGKFTDAIAFANYILGMGSMTNICWEFTKK